MVITLILLIILGLGYSEEEFSLIPQTLCGNIDALVTSSDGRYSAWVEEGGVIKIRDNFKKRFVETIEIDDYNHIHLEEILLTPHGKYLISKFTTSNYESEEIIIKIWDITKKILKRTLEGNIFNAEISYNGMYIALLSNDGEFKVLDVVRDKFIKIFENSTNQYNSLTVTPDKRYFIVVEDNNQIRLWDVDKRQFVTPSMSLNSDDYCYSIAATPDGKYFVVKNTCGKDDTIRMWDIKNKKLINIVSLINNHPPLAILSGGRYIIPFDDMFGVWDREKCRFKILERKSLDRDFTDYTCAITPDSRYFILAYICGPIRIWDLENGTLTSSNFNDWGSGFPIAISSDNGYVIKLDPFGKIIYIFDVKKRKLIKNMKNYDCLSSAIDIYNYIIACLDQKGHVFIWNLNKKEFEQINIGLKEDFSLLGLTPDHKYFIFTDKDHDVLYWDNIRHTLIKTKVVNRKKDFYNCDICNGKYYSVTPNGNYILTVKFNESKYNETIFWDPKTSEKVRDFLNFNWNSVSMSLDNKYIVVTGNQNIYLWNPTIQKFIKASLLDDPPYSISISPDSKYLIFFKPCDPNPRIKILDRTSGKIAGLNGGVCHELYSNVLITPDGKYAIFYPDFENSKNGVVTIDLRFIKIKRNLTLEEQFNFVVEDIGKYVILDTDNAIEIWDSLVDTLSKSFSDDDYDYFSYSDKYNIVKGGIKPNPQIWDIEENRYISSVNLDNNEYTQYLILANDSNIVTYNGNVIEIWDVRNGMLTNITSNLCKLTGPPVTYNTSLINNHRNPNISEIVSNIEKNFFQGINWLVNIDEYDLISLAPKYNYVILTKNYDNLECSIIEIRKFIGGELVGTFEETDSYITKILPSADGKYIVSCNKNGQIKLWNIENRKLARILSNSYSNITSFAVSKDNKYIITGCDDGSIEIWDARSGNLIKILGETAGIVSSVLITSDNKFIVTSSYNAFSYNIIEIWDTKTGKLIKTIRNNVHDFAITPNNKYLISVHCNGTLRIWRLSDGKLLLTLFSDERGNWMAYTPNGYWDANEGGKKYVVVNKIGTLETYTPGDSICDKLHYPGLISYVWENGVLP